MMDYNPGEDCADAMRDADFERYLETLTPEEQRQAIHDEWLDEWLDGIGREGMTKWL